MPDEIDPEIWALLRDAAWQVDPVPPEVTDLASASLRLVSDLQHAELVFDSWSEQTNAVRSGEPVSRVLEFSRGDHTIEIEIDRARRPTASGQVEPPGHYEIVIETPLGETARVDTASSGGFVLDALPAGPARLVVLQGSAPLVTTTWVLFVTTA